MNGKLQALYCWTRRSIVEIHPEIFNSYDKLIYICILISSYLRSIGGQKKHASIDDDIQNK